MRQHVRLSRSTVRSRAGAPWTAAMGLAACLWSVSAAGAPKTLTVADAEAAAAEGLHAKAGAIYLDVYERTADRALLVHAARQLFETKTPAGRASAARAARQYLATAETAEQEQEALDLLATIDPPAERAPEGGAAPPVPGAPPPATGAPPAEPPTVTAGAQGPMPPGAGAGGPPAAAPPATAGPPGPWSAGASGTHGGGWGPGGPHAGPPAMQPHPSEVPPGFEGYMGPPQPPEPLAPGSTDNRVPFAQRGRIGVDFGFGLVPERLSNESSDKQSVASGTLVADIPIARATFFETRVPLSLLRTYGSPTFGFHHVAEVLDGFWFTGGGAFGFPVTTPDELDEEVVVLAYPRALWDAHNYVGPLFPFQAKLALEYHVGLFGLRVQLEPALWMVIKADSPVGGAFNHALELQLGHEIGGGLRLQGVFASIGEEHSRRSLPVFDDKYQMAMQPFFVVHQDAAMVRMGMMLPLDSSLGPPFDRSFGLTIDTGVNLD